MALWVVVGGADKGGIVIREGLDTSSPLLPERLSTLAVVRQVELSAFGDGQRLNYDKVSGSGPDRGWASLKVATGKELLVEADRVWEIVGGGDKGGIVVREGLDTASPLLAERLSTGARIKQLQLVEDRLQFERVTGTGPDTGWVSLRLASGKVLVDKAVKDMGPPTIETTEAQQPRSEEGPPLEILLVNEEKAFSYEDLPLWVREQAAREKLRREGKPFLPPPVEWPARVHWMKPLQQYDVESPFVRTPDKKLREKTLQQCPGMYFGMLFPHNAEQLDSADFGAEWLTKAFHMAGTLTEDNKVTKILRCELLPTSGMDCAGGAGKKAFLDVEYEKPDPSLHSNLFIKYPYEYDFFPSQRYFLSGQFDNDGLEVRSNLYLLHLLPFRTPKVYFADISRESTNYMLITEAIPYAKRGKIVDGKIVDQPERKPYEIYPACGKFQDWLLPDPVAFYICLFRSMGQLAGWDKVGRYDSFLGAASAWNEKDYLASNPRPPQNLRAKEMTEAAVAKQADRGIEFVRKVAPQLFPSEVRDYMDKLKADLIELCPYLLDATRYYSGNNSNYMAAMHVNLQADNAYFHHDEYNELSCGVIDWGNFARSPFVANFLGCLGGMEPEHLLSRLEDLLNAFAGEYERTGGPKVAVDELLLRLHQNLVFGIYDNIQWFERTVYKVTPKEKFATLKSIRDPDFQDTWETRCRVSGWIYSLIYYVQKGTLKDEFSNWVRGKGRPYLTTYV